MRLELDGREMQALADGLQDAFTFDELRVMLLAENTGKKIENLVSPTSPMNIAFFDVVQSAERQSWTDKLLLGAAARRPDDPRLAGFLARHGVSSAGVGLLTVQAELRGGDSDMHALQRILGPAPEWSDTEVFLGSLGRLESQVCRIELGNDALGTGFLVGPDLVLTNCHVMQAFRHTPTAVSCRFDYRRIEKTRTERPGVRFALATTDWLVATSPPASADGKPDGKQPTASELDYALLRLAEAAGDTSKGDAVPKAANPRGYIRLREQAGIPLCSAPVFLLQHPKGSPLKLAVGSMLSQVNAFRMRYNADSEPGSSGAPLLDYRLDLVGLHQSSDPNFDLGHRPEFNQGVPIALIVGDLRDRVRLAPIWQ